MTIARDSRIGRGYIAREGDTGSVVWATGRNALAVSKGAARVSVSGRPGQLVFSDGASVFGAGESLYPQDAAYICPGDTGSAAQYAGRYLGKWPLQSNFFASAGFAQENIYPDPFSPGTVAFGALGGKACLIASSGNVFMRTSQTEPPALGYRSTGFTFSFSFFQTQSGFLQSFLYPETLIFADNIGSFWAVDYAAGGDSFPVPAIDVVNQWTNYVVTFVATTAKLFINGVLVDTRTINAACRTRSGPYFYVNEGKNGYRNIRVYSKALSDLEIAAIAAEDLA